MTGRDRAGLSALRWGALRAVLRRALGGRGHTGLSALRAVLRRALGGRRVGRGLTALWRGALRTVLRRALRAGAWRNIGGRLLPCRARLGLAGLAGGLRPALGRAGRRALLVLMIQVVGIIAAATQQHNQAYCQQPGWETGILLFGRRLLKALHGHQGGGRGWGRAGARGQNGLHRRGGRAQGVERLIGRADQGRVLPYRGVEALQGSNLALLLVVAAGRDGDGVGVKVFRALQEVGQLAHGQHGEQVTVHVAHCAVLVDAVPGAVALHSASVHQREGIFVHQLELFRLDGGLVAQDDAVARHIAIAGGAVQGDRLGGIDRQRGGGAQ